MVLGLNADGFDLCLSFQSSFSRTARNHRHPRAEIGVVVVAGAGTPSIGAIVLFGELRKSNDVVWGQVVARGEPKASGCTMFG